MANETILLIDADQDTDQRITTTLQEVGYTVYTAPSGVVNNEILKRLTPALIYIKPLAMSPEGFKPCKTVHDLPSPKPIPIVMLGSPKGALDPRFLTYYGIVDFLRPSFDPDELISKTRTVINKALSAQSPAEVKSVGAPQGVPPATAKDYSPAMTVKPREMALPEQRVVQQSNSDLELNEEEEKRDASPEESLAWQPAGAKHRKGFSFLRLAIGVAVLIVIAGASLVVYQVLTHPRKSAPPVVKAPPPPVPSKARETESKSKELQEEKSLAGSVPAVSAPAIPPGQPVAPVVATPATPPGQPPSPTAASSQPGRKAFYSVQLGAFKNEGAAQALVKEFQEKGYDAFALAGVMKDNSPIYRVLVGKHEDKKAARQLAREIQAKENASTILYAE
jgi:DNA-binding response OmpR family regulator